MLTECNKWRLQSITLQKEINYMVKNKYYITTAIDYVNDTIHIGHAFQKIAADVLARFYRIKLGEKNVFFLTGTDEYGQNIVKSAEKNGVTPKEWADKI